ncbi:hypothetical protein HDU82_007207 [Entophlyctis luteolus]|nr:hypothetical protein HDU82_007207 [Entophlyctis luteolus]
MSAGRAGAAIAAPQTATPASIPASALAPRRPSFSASKTGGLVRQQVAEGPVPQRILSDAADSQPATQAYMPHHYYQPDQDGDSFDSLSLSWLRVNRQNSAPLSGSRSLSDTDISTLTSPQELVGDGTASVASFDAAEARVTLHSVQRSGGILSGLLLKLDKSDNTANNTPIYKQRLVVLSDSAVLFIFKANAPPTAYPLSCLAVSSCSAYADPAEDVWILRASYEGQAVDGTPFRRSWTFKCPNKEALELWTTSVDRAIIGSMAAIPSAVPTVAKLNSTPPPPGPPSIRRGWTEGAMPPSSRIAVDTNGGFGVAVGYSSPHSAGVAMTPVRSGETLSSNGRSREVEMRIKHQEYQEYLEIQKKAAEGLRTELRLKQEAEQQRMEAVERQAQILREKEQSRLEQALAEERFRKAEIDRRKKLEKEKYEALLGSFQYHG